MRTLNVVLGLVLTVALVGCTGMTDEQQRMLSGGAIGAAGGAVIAAAAGGSVLLGTALGGAAGVGAGALMNQQQKTKDQSAKTNNHATAKVSDKSTKKSREKHGSTGAKNSRNDQPEPQSP